MKVLAWLLEKVSRSHLEAHILTPPSVQTKHFLYEFEIESKLAEILNRVYSGVPNVESVYKYSLFIFNFPFATALVLIPTSKRVGIIEDESFQLKFE
jgi:hypothetical protein